MMKKTYPITNEESLRQYILKEGKYGLQDDENLKFCYRGIENDIEDLIEQGWIRVIMTKDKNVHSKDGQKKRILFPLDKDNLDVEIDFPVHCQSYMSDLWDKKIGDIASIKWEQIL